MDSPITRAEHEEFRRAMESENQRLADEDRRQNRRIESLEKSVQQLNQLTTSVQTLAVNMENMIQLQKQQGERLEELEGRDGEKWRQVAGYVMTTVIGLIIGYVFKVIGM